MGLYNDEVRIVWKAGTDEDPYTDETTTSIIINGRIVLDNIPDPFSRVRIENFYEIITNDLPTDNQFKVNYNNGVIQFSSSNDNTIVVANYKSRGYILYPASRIYSQTDNPEVVENLQNIINTGNAIIQNLQHITISSSSPSGGVNGDMWIKYTP